MWEKDHFNVSPLDRRMGTMFLDAEKVRDFQEQGICNHYKDVKTSPLPCFKT